MPTLLMLGRGVRVSDKMLTLLTLDNGGVGKGLEQISKENDTNNH